MEEVRKYFRKYPYVLVMIVVVLVWMSINMIQGRQALLDLEKEGKYTLATITAIEGAKSGRWVTVEFEYSGRKYTAETRSERVPASWIGEKYLIKFLPSHPVEFVLYDTINVPDSLENLPTVVWDSMPVK